MKTSLLLGISLFTTLAGSLSATPIAISGTGVNGGTTDAHYAITGSTDSSVPAPSAAYITPSIWAQPLSGTNWINPSGNGSQNYCANCLYTYSTTFNLAGLNAKSATLSGRLLADDYVTIYLNGSQVSATNFGTYTQSTNFAIDSRFSSDFLAGLNTLSFAVYNTGGPTGLDVSVQGTADVATPEPSAFALLSFSGLLMIGFGSYRRRIRSASASQPINQQ